MPVLEAMTMIARSITSTKKAQKKSKKPKKKGGRRKGVSVRLFGCSGVSRVGVWGIFAYLPLIRRSLVHGTHHARLALALASGFRSLKAMLCCAWNDAGREKWGACRRWCGITATATACLPAQYRKGWHTEAEVDRKHAKKNETAVEKKSCCVW
jgi:hypothetical protein